MFRELSFGERGWGTRMGRARGVRARSIRPYRLSPHLFSNLTNGKAFFFTCCSRGKHGRLLQENGAAVLSSAFMGCSSSSSFASCPFLSASCRHVFTSSLPVRLSAQDPSSPAVSSPGSSPAFSPFLGDAALSYTSPPPRPQDYVSPEERGVEDPSLEFLPDEHPLKKEYIEHRKVQEAERIRRLEASLEEEKVEIEEGSEVPPLQRRNVEVYLPPLGEHQLRAPSLAGWSEDETKPFSQASRPSMGKESTLLEAFSTSEGHSFPQNPKIIHRGEYDDIEEALREALVEAGAEGKEGEEKKEGSSSSSTASTREPETNEAEEAHSSTSSFSFRGGFSSRSSSPPFSMFSKASPHKKKSEDLETAHSEEEGPKGPSSFSFASQAGSESSTSRSPLGNEHHTETSTEGKRRPRISLTRTQEMELAAQKLEYYFGTPQYPNMLAAFLQEYAEELRGEEEEEMEAGSKGSSRKGEEEGSRKMGESVYSEKEVEQGLEAQPIDYLRSSKKLQLQLHEGPRAYDPITVLQRQGWMRFQGYAFPPSTELGKLKLDGGKGRRGGGGSGDGEDNLPVHWEDVDRQVRYRDSLGGGASGIVRRAFFQLLGKEDPNEKYLMPPPSEAAVPRTDKSLIYRVTGLDIVQRRQVRYMLTDFDYSDRQTAFHVMMTYPHTDWIHVFYMVSVGVGLYWLQIHFNAYEWYDEYLGLDLRQAPSAKKPFIAAVTTMVMVYLLFQPLLVASIATTRLYRIIRRRPIGPP